MKSSHPFAALLARHPDQKQVPSLEMVRLETECTFHPTGNGALAVS